MKLNEKISKLRKEKKMSQEQLADSLKVSRQAVSKWESGNAYPEMDKLLELCKIFGCTLEELTNEEIIVEEGRKAKNPINDIVNEVTEFVNKSISMVTTISLKEIIKIIFVMFIVSILIGVFQIPFKYIDDLGRNVLMNLGRPIGSSLSSIWHFIIYVVYIVGGLSLFIMIYKRRYLDNYEIKEIKKIVVEKKVEDDNDNKELKKEKVVVYENSYSLLKGITNLIIIAIKVLIMFMLIPFVIAIVCSAIGLAISIFLIFDGLYYFGIPLMCIACLAVLGTLLEVVINFIFDKKSKPKKILLSIFIGLVLFGIGFGITLIDVSEINIVNEKSNKYSKDTLTQIISYNDNLLVDISHYHDIEYIVDESLTNDIKIECTYYKEFTVPRIEVEDNELEVYSMDDEFSFELIDNFIDDLKDKKIYNYNDLTKYNIKLYTSESNINKLKENEQKEYYYDYGD